MVVYRSPRLNRCPRPDRPCIGGEGQIVRGERIIGRFAASFFLTRPWGDGRALQAVGLLRPTARPAVHSAAVGGHNQSDARTITGVCPEYVFVGALT